MNKKWTTAVIIILLLVLAGYIVIDIALREKETGTAPLATKAELSAPSDMWSVTRIFEPGQGQLNAVTSDKGILVLGGESFAVCYDTAFNLKWDYKTGVPVTALAIYGNRIYAAIQASVIVLDLKGEKTGEWGPFESNAMITSVAANDTYVAFADAANKAITVLDKEGNVKYFIGRSDNSFVIPSYYFDIALDDQNTLYVANTGNRRIEKRSIDGLLKDYFGEPGNDPGAFCGCCNPSHFALIPDGFVTAEKGINRIKILNRNGEFVEFVSSVNNFVPPLPLDITSPDGKTIFGANSADSKIYIFKRKNEKK